MTDNGKILYLDMKAIDGSSRMDMPHETGSDQMPRVSPGEFETDSNAAESLADASAVLSALVDAIVEKEQNPVTQLAGYLTTEDPTYLPEGNNARMLARKIGRDRLLEALLELYMSECKKEFDQGGRQDT